MINIDGSFVVQMINFIFLIWVMNAVLYKPVRRMLARRHEKVDGLQTRIDTCETDARNKDIQFGEGLRAARARGQAEKERLVTAAGEQEQQIIDRISRQNQARLAEMRETIQAEAAKARDALQPEVDTFAAAICEKILGRAF